MASRAYEAAPLDVLLSAIPSLPRPILERIVQRAIDHMDDEDGCEDDEDNNDAEAIDEREPENWIGGDGDEPDLSLFYPHQPHPDLARIRRQLRRMKGGARTN